MYHYARKVVPYKAVVADPENSLYEYFLLRYLEKKRSDSTPINVESPPSSTRKWCAIQCSIIPLKFRIAITTTVEHFRPF